VAFDEGTGHLRKISAFLAVCSMKVKHDRLNGHDFHITARVEVTLRWYNRLPDGAGSVG
jgi:hypothetical protein